MNKRIFLRKIKILRIFSVQLIDNFFLINIKTKIYLMIFQRKKTKQERSIKKNIVVINCRNEKNI